MESKPISPHVQEKVRQILKERGFPEYQDVPPRRLPMDRGEKIALVCFVVFVVVVLFFMVSAFICQITRKTDPPPIVQRSMFEADS